MKGLYRKGFSEKFKSLTSTFLNSYMSERKSRIALIQPVSNLNFS